MVNNQSNDLPQESVSLRTGGNLMEKARNKKNSKQRAEKLPPKSENKPPLPVPQANEESEERDPWDFGGLPDRDLKKNLGGCG